MAARGKLPDAVQRKVAEAVKTNWPVLPDTVPMALENPACSIANITRVCTGSML